MNPTIAYVTSRRNSRFDEWFLPALARQRLPTEEPLVVKIDRFATEVSSYYHGGIKVQVHPPKPCVWSGPHRLTSQDWFSASSYRNTALCLCESQHVAYCDDLSVPDPNWWQAAKDATAYPDTITCGLCNKVNDMVVEDGVLTSFTPSQSGADYRLQRLRKEGNPQSGYWRRSLWGCSSVAPVEALLTVGGWPEFADGLSYEDVLLGWMLENAGYKFRFDQRFFTHENEHAHHEEEPMVRRDKGVSPNDKSHAARRVAQGTKYFENYYPGGTRALRDHVLAGNPFPVPTGPTHDWYDNQSIAEMDPSKMP